MIQLILVGVIGIIMFFSLLVGFIQGFRKNVYKLIATILFWTIFWCTAPFVKGEAILKSTMIYDYLAAYLPPIDGSACTTLFDYIIYTLANMLDISHEMLQDEAIQSTLIAILQNIVKIVYLIVYAIVFGIINKLVYAIFFKKRFKISKKYLRKLKRKQEKYVKRHGVENKSLEKQITRKEKQLRNNKIFKPLGIASGFCRGLISSFLILCIVNSLFNLLPGGNKNNETASNDTNNEEVSLYDFILDYCNDNPILVQAVEMIKEYQESTLINVTKVKIGNQYADDLFIDSIISGKANDYSFALRKELSSIIQIAENVFYLTNGFDFENVNWTNLSLSQIENVENVLKILANDDLLINLGSNLVGIAISLDAVAEYIPSNLSSVEYESINWTNELTTIASLVSKVYSLGDLSKLDYMDLDADVVEDIMLTLSNLNSINFLGHIGCNLAIKQSFDNSKYQEEIASIENKLADLAINGGFTQLIEDYSDLYGRFISLYKDIDSDKFKDEEGNINYLTALTSVETTKYSSIVNTVLETNFVNELLPDVLKIVRNTIPPEFASLINPSVVSSTQWENEINAVLKIVHDITYDYENKEIRPFETIEKYDFSLLRNFTPETVVQSDLLSYAIIKIFVDATKSQGILSSVSGDIANYVSVPDYLTVLDESTHRFADKWYGDKTLNYKNGELYIVFDTIKNCASQLKNLNYPIGSIPAILAAIDSEELTGSDVLYYTVNHLIKENQTFIVIPVSETETSLQKVNGEYLTNAIKRSAMKEVIDVFTNPNIIDLEQLFVYYKYDKETNECASVPTDIKDIENMDDYIAKLNTDTERLLGLLTSKKLYDSTKQDESNLNILFASNILRATLTDLIVSNFSDVIVVPNNATSAEEECLKVVKQENGSTQLTSQSMKIVNPNQFKALIRAIDDLKIDMLSLMEDPIKIVDQLKNEDGTIKEEIKPILGSSGYLDSRYCGILHATLSKYVIEFSDDSTGDLVIVVPNEAKDVTDTSLITSKETINLIDSLLAVGIEIFTDDTISDDEKVNRIMDKVIEDDRVFNSLIIRATMTNYIDNQLGSQLSGFELPNGVYEEMETKVIAKAHIDDLLQALRSLKNVKNQELIEEGKEPLDYMDLLNIENLTISVLVKTNDIVDGNGNRPLSKSLILRGVLANQLEQNGIEVPFEAKEDDALSVNETNTLITILGDILDSNSSFNNINVDSITIGRLVDAKDSLSSSLIVKKLLTDELNKQSDIVVPDNAFDTSITSTNIISTAELNHLIDGLGNILSSSSTVNNISIDDITVEKIHLAKDDISASFILNATITKQLKDIDDVVVPSSAYNLQASECLSISEVNALIDCLYTLLDHNSKVTAISVDAITIQKIYDSKENIKNSNVINATITKNLKGQADIVVPDDAYVNVSDKEMLISAEVDNVIEGLYKLLNASDSVSNISVNDITVGKINLAKVNISSSFILNATIAKNVNEQADIVVPDDAFTTSDKVLLKSTEIETLIDGLCGLLDENDSVSNINVDTITVQKIYDTKLTISSSLILNATITKQLKGQEDVVIPESAYEDLTLQYLQESQLTMLIDGLYTLLGASSSVSNINVDTITVQNIYDSKDSISNSLILNATITKQLKGQADVVIPESAYDDDTYLSLASDQLSYLIDGLYGLLDPESNVSTVNVNTITIQKIYDTKLTISNSLVLNATITKQLKGQAVNGIIIPNVSYEDLEKQMLTSSEIDNVISGLHNIFDKEGALSPSISNININSITLKDIDNSKISISNSFVLNATITGKLQEQSSSIAIPLAAYRTDIGEANKVLDTSEMTTMISGLVTLFGESSAINAIDVNNMTVKNINDSKTYIIPSLILRATITKHLEDQPSIIIPSHAIDSNNIVSESEIEAFIEVINKLFAQNEKVIALPVDNLTLNNLNSASLEITASWIFKGTITDKVEKINDGGDEIVIPGNAYESGYLSSTEIINILAGLNSLFGDVKVNEVSNFNALNLSHINSAMTYVSNSYILRATISNEVMNVSAIKIPLSNVENLQNKETLENTIKALKVDSLTKLFDAISAMNITQFNNISQDNMKLPLSAKDRIIASDVMLATITNNIKVNVDGVAVPLYSLISDANVIKDINNVDILSLSSNEFGRIIDSIATISNDGSIVIDIDIALLISLKQNNKLDTLISSNMMRIVIGKYLTNGFSYEGSSINYSSMVVNSAYISETGSTYEFVSAGYGMYKFKAETSADVYCLPSISETTTNILQKEDIVEFISYVIYLASV
ncbi:MAG: hypothetical protein MR270_02440 [Erysipelotrichaceae bacterium]|nr:hypothetical protein [Erysipelotrichaceae bacterium]